MMKTRTIPKGYFGSLLRKTPLLGRRSRMRNRIRIHFALFTVLAASVFAEKSPPIDLSDISGGVVSVYGCTDADMLMSLQPNDRYLVHGLATDAQTADNIRRILQDKKRYGSISVEHYTERWLPYGENLINLFVAEDAETIDMDEVMRVLVPNGVALIKNGDTWKKITKPPVGSHDEWTHFLYNPSNNAVSQDTEVGPPARTQWFAKPLWIRTHENDSSLSAMVSSGGKIFYIYDEGPVGITDMRLPPNWFVICRDAYNGTLLWKKPLPNWGWREWKTVKAGLRFVNMSQQRQATPSDITRHLVARNGRVYVSLGYDAPVSVLDAETGETLDTFAETVGVREVFVLDNAIVAVTQPAGSDARCLVVVDRKNGQLRWKKDFDLIARCSTAANEERVVTFDTKATYCFDLKSGEQLWITPVGKYHPPVDVFHQNESMLLTEDVVLHGSRIPKSMRNLLSRKSKGDKKKKGKSSKSKIAEAGQTKEEPIWKTVVALDARTGKELWYMENWAGLFNRQGAPEMFVIDGQVWAGAKGISYDLRTGKETGRIELPKYFANPGHHYRCFPNKATVNWIFGNKRGTELLSLRGKEHSRNNWVRGSCKYGSMPANGLLYTPPHQCFCYIDASLRGFNALSSGGQAVIRPLTPAQRLEKGAAFGAVPKETTESSPTDWPAYRCDNARSGFAAAPIAGKLAPAWEVQFEGALSQTVSAGDQVYVTAIDTHTVHCLSISQGGKELWRFTAGGRIDSAPSIYGNALFFGSADGYVYCISAVDGLLAWRFKAAPAHRRVMAWGQIESAWPVHGAVVVKDGLCYAVAGRSSFLDDGIHLYGLDAKTGAVVHHTTLSGPHVDINVHLDGAYSMRGWLSEIPSADDGHIFMRQAQFSNELVWEETPSITKYDDRKVARHIFSTAGLLDDSGFNRTYWMNSDRWPGFYLANNASQEGQLLVTDGEHTYCARIFDELRNVHSPFFYAGTKASFLFADRDSTESYLPPDQRNKGIGFVRKAPPAWRVVVPVVTRAMAGAGDTLFIAGPPDEFNSQDPLAVYEGRNGGLLCAFNKKTGEKLSETDLGCSPVWDGLSVANGHVFVSLKDGRVRCFRSQ